MDTKRSEDADPSGGIGSPESGRPKPAMRPAARLASLSLVVAAGLTLADGLTERHLFALFALAFIFLHVTLMWPRLRPVARMMLVLAVAVAVAFLIMGGDTDRLALAASRALFLPALLMVMVLLRAAAQQSRQVGTAADYVVEQPPGRRYWLLVAGGHIFGILLNVGGFQLLLRIALGRLREAAADALVWEARRRQITNAVMRGFTSTILWSPVGIAMNLILPLMTGVGWIDFVPIGLGLVVLFVCVGWFVDRLESRLVAVRHERQPGAIGAMLMLVGLLVVISSLSAAAEILLGVPMRTAILVVVPCVAAAWTLAEVRGDPLRGLAGLGRTGFRMIPESASEVCMIGATGFVGLLLAEMIPADVVSGVFAQAGASAGIAACAIVVILPALGLIGINPIVTGTAIVGAAVGAGLPIPETMLMAAALSGWAAAMMLSPITVTVAIASAGADRSSTQVGLHWNGLFTAVFMAAVIGILLVWSRLLIWNGT